MAQSNFPVVTRLDLNKNAANGSQLAGAIGEDINQKYPKFICQID